MPVTTPDPTEPVDASRLAARREALSQITTALDALLRKLGEQREVAMCACALAPQIEQIAGQARRLAFTRSQVPTEEMAELVKAIAAMAADVADIAQEIERGAALGGEIVTRIGGPLAELIAIARDPERLTDTRALRGVLTSLAGVLTEVSRQRAGEGASGRAVQQVGRRAASMAKRAQALSLGMRGLQNEVLGLSRDLAAFAAETVQVAAALNRDAESAQRALSAMTAEVQTMHGPTEAAGDAGVEGKIASLLRAERASRQGQAVDWGVPTGKA